MNVPFAPGPVVLQGASVRLEPLNVHHVDDLLSASADEAIWRYLPIAQPGTRAEMRRWVDEALRDMAGGAQVSFAIVNTASRRAVGSTRYLDIQRTHRNLEIGWTWLGAEYRRTSVNTECKFLLLRHAFEALGALRVCFKTDARNLPSQRAIERIGGQREGTFRNHMIVRDGYVRDSVYYSIIDREWPDVKARLEAMLAV
jgi:RimJ/RimL family protein N-acetyltransferase